MQFSNDILIRIIIFVLGVSGFLIAKHIRNHKTKNTPLICPGKFDCHSVVYSDYSEFFGIPVETIGMIYYAFISLAYLFFIFTPNAISVNLVILLTIMSLVAFLFSIYLIGVQILILRKGCLWCFISAFISISIFILLFI